MTFQFPEQCIVTGTDTDVGKTLVSAVITLGMGARYWKPIQAGTHPGTDTALVQEWTGLDASHFIGEAYCLSTPASPHLAARLEGVRVSLDALPSLEQATIPLVVEGAGGVLVPMNEQELMVDLFVRLGLPVVVVARTKLGTINHTLLTLEALRARDIPIAGVVLSGEWNPFNHEAIRHYGRVEILGHVPLLERIDRDTWLPVWNSWRVRELAR
jgi:dethiobiotin synthase